MTTARKPLGENRRVQELLGIALLFLALASLLSLLSYDHRDANWFSAGSESGPARNWIGAFGANLAELLLQLFGIVALVTPLVLAPLGWSRLRHRTLALSRTRIAGLVVLGLALSALISLLYGHVRFGGEAFRSAGLVGHLVATAMVWGLARLGAIFLATALVAAMIVLTTRFSFSRAAEAAGPWLTRAGRSSWNGIRSLARRDKPRVDRKKPAPRKSPAAASSDSEPTEAPRPRGPIPVELSSAAKPESSPAIAPAAERKPAPRPAASRPRQSELPLRQEFRLPGPELLNDPVEQSVDNEKELLERAGQLTEKFREFNVDGTVVAIHPGPVVTTFEFKPEAGVKYSKITGMSDDLCLALRAESVRIDRIPGRSTVGIEVPNRKQETIYMRELVDSEKFAQSESLLTLALGKDIGGDVFVARLERMPHLLIAGATGAGKSVMLNGIITSILYKATPADARLIMIDTKMIELGVYADIPHLLIPVVTDPKKASTALKWAVREMETRYKKLAAVGVRNLDQFNELLKAEPERTMDTARGETVQLEPMPYILIVIDEMADLMMVSSADVEESVMRLAQMARAVGIHLILATQRPSVDVITGTIKANFPSRIAFRVSQRVDSRTIIDQNGAESLLGRGDMLYLATGSARLQRLHSGFITEAELNRVTEFLKSSATPIYDESVLKDPEEESRAAGGFEGERDVMYGEAVRLILNEGQCSITLIQRRMRLGYARAARIVDMMEQEGVIGPADGSKPREILVGPEYIETLESSRP